MDIPEQRRRARPGREITALKQAESARRESEERYRTIFERAGDGIALHDLEGSLLDVNPALCEMLGYRREELLGMSLGDVDTPGSARLRPVRMRKLAEEGRCFFEAEYVAKGGRVFPVEVSAQVVEFRSRPGVLAIVRDVSERKERECRLTSVLAEAESFNQAKTEFLANMRYEVRTPLYGLLGVLQLLQSVDLSPEQAEYVAMAVASCRGLAASLNDILDFARIKAGARDVSESRFELRRLLGGVMRLFTRQAARKALGLRYKVDGDDPCHVMCDQGKLRQILINLVGNAVRHTERGEVAVKASRLDDNPAEDTIRLLFEVADSGPGIPPDVLGRAFEPLSLGPETSPGDQSWPGLGLRVVKRLVERLGGSLSISSTEGVGTKVFFTIVARRAPANQGSALLQEPRAPHGPACLHLLLVEDDELNMLAQKRMLELAGHIVIAVPDGARALDLLSRERFDCVIMDISLLGMDGLETARRIRATGPGKADVPIIAVTAHTSEEDQARFLRAGMNGFVAKPLLARDLIEAVRRVVAERRNV